MDKSSPVYENFAKKMDAMSGKPKINKSTFKIGGGGLEGRVATNEKKITLLKNIFKQQKVEIGEKITPKVNTLEESLINTTQILGVISQKLQLDMDQRINDQKAAFDNQRKLNLADKRGSKEEELEAKKKSKVVSKLGKAAIKPFEGIFDKLKRLAMILGTGILSTNLIKALKNEDFREKLENIFNWTTKNWKAIAIAGGIIVALDIGLKLFGAFKALKFAFGILSAPVVLKALAIAAFAYGAFTILREAEKGIDKISEINKEKSTKLLGFEDTTEMNKFDKASEQAKANMYTNFATSSITGTSLPAYMGKEEVNKFQEYVEGGDIPMDMVDFLNKKSINEEKYLKLVKEKKIPKVNVIDGGKISLKDNNQIKEFKTNNLQATEINTIASVNAINPYMEQVPMLFGFSDLVYS
jgi:hypothetical protein